MLAASFRRYCYLSQCRAGGLCLGHCGALPPPPLLPAETGQKREFGLERLEKDPVRRNCGGNYRIPMEGEGSRLNIALSLFFRPLTPLWGAVESTFYCCGGRRRRRRGPPTLAHPGSRGRGWNSTFWTILYLPMNDTQQEYADKYCRCKGRKTFHNSSNPSPSPLSFHPLFPSFRCPTQGRSLLICYETSNILGTQRGASFLLAPKEEEEEEGPTPSLPLRVLAVYLAKVGWALDNGGENKS